MKDAKQQGTIVVNNDIYEVYLKLKKAISWCTGIDASDSFVFEFWLFPALKDYLLQTEDEFSSDKDTVFKLFKHFLKGEDIETLPDELIPFIPEKDIQEMREYLLEYVERDCKRWDFEQEYKSNGLDEEDYEVLKGEKAPEAMTDDDYADMGFFNKVISIWDKANNG